MTDFEVFGTIPIEALVRDIGAEILSRDGKDMSPESANDLARRVVERMGRDERIRMANVYRGLVNIGTNYAIELKNNEYINEPPTQSDGILKVGKGELGYQKPPYDSRFNLDEVIRGGRRGGESTRTYRVTGVREINGQTIFERER